MHKRRRLTGVSYPEVVFLKDNRFEFVKDDLLRENISISMQYVVFLLSLYSEYEVGGPVLYSMNKTIVLFTASIIESLIYHKVKGLLATKKFRDEDAMEPEDVYVDEKILFEISETEWICGVHKKKKFKEFKGTIQFAELNRVAKRIGLFDSALFNKAEKIREMRNKIHLNNLKGASDDKFETKDLKEVFGIVKDLIGQIKDFG